MSCKRCCLSTAAPPSDGHLRLYRNHIFKQRLNRLLIFWRGEDVRLLDRGIAETACNMLQRAAIIVQAWSIDHHEEVHHVRCRHGDSPETSIGESALAMSSGGWVGRRVPRSTWTHNVDAVQTISPGGSGRQITVSLQDLTRRIDRTQVATNKVSPA